MTEHFLPVSVEDLREEVKQSPKKLEFLENDHGIFCCIFHQLMARLYL